MISLWIKGKPAPKVKLTIEEINTMASLEISDPNVRAARDIWLSAYYFHGMRMGDILMIKNYTANGDRLVYSMQKNKKPKRNYQSEQRIS